MKKLDGFDEAIIGINYDEERPRLVYDINLIVDKLRESGMTREDSEEYADFNIVGGHYGEGGPLFVEGVHWERALEIAALFSEEG